MHHVDTEAAIVERDAAIDDEGLPALLESQAVHADFAQTPESDEPQRAGLRSTWPRAMRGGSAASASSSSPAKAVWVRPRSVPPKRWRSPPKASASSSPCAMPRSASAP